jgi:hypothetical protein
LKYNLPKCIHQAIPFDVLSIRYRNVDERITVFQV